MRGDTPTPTTIELLRSIHPVSRETIGRLTIYHTLLRRWQAKTNLVAPSTLEDFWMRHVADSLQVLALAPPGCVITDLGSGGGFPGMVLAIARSDPPGSAPVVHLIESNRKKCAFLRQVAQKTGAVAEIWPIRIESAAKQMSAATLLTARALAPLATLFSLTEGHITGKKRAIFHKGRDYRTELAECRGQWRFDLIEHQSRVDAGSVLLEITNVTRRAST